MPADSTIGDLTAASTLDGTEVLPVEQSSTTKKATVDQVRDSVLSDVLAFCGMSATVVDTTPRWTVASAVGPVAGTLYLVYFTPLINLTVDTFTVVSSNAVPSSGITLGKIGLYTAAANGDVTLVARSANNTSLVSVINTQYDEAFSTTGGYPASYDLVAGTRYAVGALQVGGTPGRFAGVSTAINLAVPFIAPYLHAMKTGETDIAGNVATVAQSTTNMLWARLS